MNTRPAHIVVGLVIGMTVAGAAQDRQIGGVGLTVFAATSVAEAPRCARPRPISVASG